MCPSPSPGKSDKMSDFSFCRKRIEPSRLYSHLIGTFMLHLPSPFVPWSVSVVKNSLPTFLRQKPKGLVKNKMEISGELFCCQARRENLPQPSYGRPSRSLNYPNYADLIDHSLLWEDWSRSRRSSHCCSSVSYHAVSSFVSPRQKRRFTTSALTWVLQRPARVTTHGGKRAVLNRYVILFRPLHKNRSLALLLFCHCVALKS